MLVHECSVGAAETAEPPGRVAWVWQGCHTLLSVFCGQYISARLVQQRLLHPLNFLWVPCILWENTAALPERKKTKRAWRNAMPSYL